MVGYVLNVTSLNVIVAMKKFIEAQRKQWDTDPDTKIYVDWIIKSKTPMKVKARLYYD